MTDQFGVDLSENQTITSYAQLNGAIDFAYLRVRRSNGKQDGKWRNFRAGITKPCAPYIFLRDPGMESFQSQFESFWGWADDAHWEWGPVLDCEFVGLTGAEIRSAVATSRQVTGKDVQYVYVGRGNLVGLVPPSSFVTDDDVRLIASRYFANNKSTAWDNLGFTHPNLDMVQYWDKGTVPGISGIVDLNLAHQIMMEGTSVALTQADIDAVAAATASKVWTTKRTGETVDMSQHVANADVNNTPAKVWAYSNAASGDTVDMHQVLINIEEADETELVNDQNATIAFQQILTAVTTPGTSMPDLTAALETWLASQNVNVSVNLTPKTEA